MAAAIGRREALAGIGAVAVLGGVGATTGETAAAVRTRREISDLERWFPTELDLYRRAVGEVSKSVAGTSAWERNARVHAAHCGVGTPNEIHRTLRFLPWHRAFLWMTERNLRHAVGDDRLALPYWHWPVAGAVPQSFTKGPLDHPRANLALARADHQFAAAMATADRYVGELDTTGPRPVVVELGFGGYTGVSFLSALEGTPHGAVHNKIGNDDARGVYTDMGDIRWSPRDPIFFGHHGNLDRLWEAWRGPPGSARRKTEPWADTAFADASFDFFDLSTGLTRPVRLSEVQETDALGYRYAAPGEGPAGTPPAGAAAQGQDTSPVAPDPAALGAPLARGEAALTAPPTGTSTASTPTKAILTVQGIGLPGGRGVTVAVYLTRRGERPFRPATAQFAGLVGLVRQDAEAKVSLALDVTAALRATRVDAGRVGVALVPVGASGAPLAVEGYAIRISPR
ncbi:tyrosinase family protein [Sphingomonas panni]